MFQPFRIAIVFVLVLVFFSCVSENDLDPPVDDPVTVDPSGPLAGLNVSASFDYTTSDEVNVSLDVPTFLSKAVFTLYSKTGSQDSIPFGRATFDSEGHFEQDFVLTAQADSVILVSDYIGLTKDIHLAIQNNAVSFDYRPLYDRSGTASKVAHTTFATSKGKRSLTSKVDYTYLSSYNSLGVPDDMELPDVIQQNLLDDVNASLPERSRVPIANPQFLANESETSMVLTDLADVWVTFVSEGAGFRNAIGYYSYPIGQKPDTVDDITAHNIIFPNVSMVGSSGGLVPGDRVYLGRFPPNTVVSWFIVANGWNGSDVGDGRNIFYSDPTFNPENGSLSNHMVQLYDSAREINFLAFEDLRRDQGSDDDFNDAVFYARANPVESIELTNVVALIPANDSDGDGVNDELDDFPFDVNQAFNNFSPSENLAGVLAYEDLWPSQGDYDFNDLVVSYSYNLITNSSNEITRIEGTYTVDNIGGAQPNGFALFLPVDPSLVNDVQGQVINADFINLNANGTESGTTADETVIFIAGNTIEMQGSTINIGIDFKTPVGYTDLGLVPFNPFLISNGDRSREIHLPDFPPTSKAALLSSSDDDSDPSSERYYKTATNLPWALNIFDEFVAPAESIPITIEYPRFVNWANSGGTQDLDWYSRQ
ncbi:LruC domain-containing protein [Flagellimonas meridianipacifica]|uniref:LruC domain-containing protein n=1 Tax=Flagellimonas meridianipacifica TaxID=1080225 RepID=A0A2T0MJ16_9FLAO|nr:LruC domain-containing protein [Allomuricauda pacifica]PRX57577.1 LruC domain-containing protein [Allomuricauda pacifica]